MIRNRLYYGIKPFLPFPVRLWIRQWLAIRKREQVRAFWPIMPGSELPPQGWPGWPEGKQFALVLTHDVEGSSGVSKCERVMGLEQHRGFRSAFNLVPEGEYSTTSEFRDNLKRNGFEVGVHDLYHNGKLFLTKREFSRNAVQINRYLKDWGVAGFRSAFMLHNLDWLHDLNIQYDASTFDVDPFEPQPQGRNTVFPFWVPRRSSTNPPIHQFSSPTLQHSSTPLSLGYVELPYTLPQDSTLFLILRERHPDTWLRKLDWIAKHGGMALLNVHPDYMRFEGEPVSPRTYPADFYARFLEYVKQRYGDSFWQPLPAAVSEFVRNCRASLAQRTEGQ